MKLNEKESSASRQTLNSNNSSGGDYSSRNNTKLPKINIKNSMVI